MDSKGEPRQKYYCELKRPARTLTVRPYLYWIVCYRYNWLKLFITVSEMPRSLG